MVLGLGLGLGFGLGSLHRKQASGASGSRAMRVSCVERTT